MIEKPVWFDYVVWGYEEDEDGCPIPYIKGLKKGTPKEIQKEFKKQNKEFSKAKEENPDVYII